jgi:hypothetical protein
MRSRMAHARGTARDRALSKGALVPPSLGNFVFLLTPTARPAAAQRNGRLQTLSPSYYSRSL